jgi:hypothetical protein
VLHLVLKLRVNPNQFHVLLTDSPLCQLTGTKDGQFEINLILFNKFEADAEGTPVED